VPDNANEEFRKVEWYTGALHQAWYEDEVCILLSRACIL
jgi:hypothetical protein